MGKRIAPLIGSAQSTVFRPTFSTPRAFGRPKTPGLRPEAGAGVRRRVTTYLHLAPKD